MFSDIDIMARTIYGEARGEYSKFGIDSLVAIAHVIMNRSRERDEDVQTVCLTPKQFSCWNKGDPNRKLVENVTMKDGLFLVCYSAAFQTYIGKTKDVTNGANHYYSKFLKKPPYWAFEKKPVKTIGNHIFFKL